MCGCGGGGSSVKQLPLQQARGRVVNNGRMVEASQAPGQQRPGDVLVTVLFREGSPHRPDNTPYGYMQKGETWYVDPADLAAHSNWFRAVAVPEPA